MVMRRLSAKTHPRQDCLGRLNNSNCPSNLMRCQRVPCVVSAAGVVKGTSSGASSHPLVNLQAGFSHQLSFMPKLPSFFGRCRVGVQAVVDAGGGGGGAAGGSGEGDGEGGDDGGAGDDEDNRVLSLEQVEALCQKRGISLPSDMLQTASQYGLRAFAVEKFFKLQGLFFTGWLVRALPPLRDRLIADNLFLFKIFVELLIDSGCTTVAELRKRGDKFWEEFEFYLSDLSVGLVLDIALVSLMAPVAIIGGGTKAGMATGIQKSLANVPSAFFAASVPGVQPYTLGQRLACLAVKFGEYSLAGISCGLVGQGICNALMNWRREHVGAKETDVTVPPLLRTALVWGLFMGVSSNLRYQAVFGIERLVDLTIAKRVPQVAYATTVAVRFANNVLGGENFIDLARWAGVQ